GAAFIYSIVAVFKGGHVYFEAAAVITTLVLLGQVLELRARERTSGAIESLITGEPLPVEKATGARCRSRSQRPTLPTTTDPIAIGSVVVGSVGRWLL